MHARNVRTRTWGAYARPVVITVLLLAAFHEGEQQAIEPSRSAVCQVSGPLDTDEPFTSRHLYRFHNLILGVYRRQKSVGNLCGHQAVCVD